MKYVALAPADRRAFLLFLARHDVLDREAPCALGATLFFEFCIAQGFLWQSDLSTGSRPR